MSLVSTSGASRKDGHVRPAERARTLLASAVDLRVGVLNMSHEINRHAVGTDGSLLFLAPADSRASVFGVAPRLPSQVVTVTAVDVANVPQRDRVRGTLRLTGPVRPAVEPLPAGVLDHLAGPDPRDPEVAGPVLPPAAHQGRALVALRGPQRCRRRPGADPGRGLPRRFPRPAAGVRGAVAAAPAP